MTGKINTGRVLTYNSASHSFYPESYDGEILQAGLLTYSMLTGPSRSRLWRNSGFAGSVRAYSYGDSSGLSPDSLLISQAGNMSSN